MDARKRSGNKNDAKKPLVSMASDNHTSETNVTAVYTTIYAPTRHDPICFNYIYILRESVFIFRTENI